LAQTRRSPRVDFLVYQPKLIVRRQPLWFSRRAWIYSATSARLIPPTVIPVKLAIAQNFTFISRI
jgi:hypothetical protein